jgi:hypothetical protein
MAKRWLPSVICTISALGACRTSIPDPDTQSSVSSGQGHTAGSVATTHKPKEPKTRRRKITQPDFQKKYFKKGPSLTGSKVLNPQVQGRSVMTSSAGLCYILLPPPKDAPPGPPGSMQGTTQYVDCPPAMDDPAWDSCHDDELAQLASGDCLCLSSWGNPPPPPSHAPCPEANKKKPSVQALPIAQSYSGRFRRQLRPGAPAGSTASRVIREVRAFAELISMIPSHRIQKKQPAPPSDDPLLKKPSIDWSKKMVLVVFRDDSMYVAPKLQNPRVEKGRLVVDHIEPPLGDTARLAAAGGIGTYAAIVVDRFEGPIDFRKAN